MRRSLTALLALFWLTTAAPAADRLGAPLTFVDARGNTVTTADFPGKWLLIHFGYTHCADLCPTSLSVLVNALGQIGPAAKHFQPLFVTVDPERDHGPALQKFADAFDKRIVGLGGSLDQVRMAADALGVAFQKVRQGEDAYTIDHSASYTLIAPDRTTFETFRRAEPHQLAAKLIDTLVKARVPLDDVNNYRAYR